MEDDYEKLKAAHDALPESFTKHAELEAKQEKSEVADEQMIKDHERMKAEDEQMMQL